jgi:hypothetical protein
MTSLTVEPTATNPQVPSPELSDEDTLGPNDQRTATSDTPDRPVQGHAYYERRLGNSELSYYLPARAAGVNDMSANPS